MAHEEDALKKGNRRTSSDDDSDIENATHLSNRRHWKSSCAHHPWDIRLGWSGPAPEASTG